MTRARYLLAGLAGAVAGAAALIAVGIAMGVEEDLAAYDPAGAPNPNPLRGGYPGPTAHENVRTIR